MNANARAVDSKHAVDEVNTSQGAAADKLAPKAIFGRELRPRLVYRTAAVLALAMASWLPTQVNADGIDVRSAGCIGACGSAYCCEKNITLNTNGVGFARNFKCVEYMKMAGSTERAWICGELRKQNAVCSEVADFCPKAQKAPKEAEWKKCRNKDTTFKTCCDQDHLGGTLSRGGHICCWDDTPTTSNSGSTSVVEAEGGDIYQSDTQGRPCSELLGR